MRMLRSRVLGKNVALGIAASFFLQAQIVPVSSREIKRSKRSHVELVRLDYNEQATLRPFLSSLIEREQVSEDVRRCADSVRNDEALEANVVLRALPDLMYHIFTAKDEMRRSVKTKADLASSSDKVRDVLSAMRALSKVGESLAHNESLNQLADFKYVMQALEDFLGDLPAGDVDDLVDFLRFVGDPTGLGIRQILVKVASCVDILVPCCQTVSSKLDDCCFSIISKLDNISDFTVSSKLDQCCFTIISKIDHISEPCAATPIFASTTLSASGTYCLAQDIVGTTTGILINGNNIVLDLNGHAVNYSATGGTCIQVTSKNVVVSNGSVFKSGAPDAGSGNGIVLSAASDVVLEDLFISGVGSGISISGVSGTATDVVVSQVDCNGVGVAIFMDSNTSNVSVKQSKFNNFTAIGIHINGSTKVTVSDCVLNSLTSVFALEIDNSASCINILNTSASRNAALPGTTGYNISTSSGVFFNNCTACGFSFGFVAGFANSLNIFNCVAFENGTGFSMSSGNGILRGNTANNNSSTGFFNNGTFQFYSNVACNNPNNFIGVTSASVTSPENARGVHNVDCTNTTPDEVLATLSMVDSCCFTMSSQIDSVHTDLDLCCSALNSKIDQLTIFVEDGIANDSICCFSLNSKIDVVGACQQASFDSCCFTSTCDIDNSCLTVIQWLKTIYRDIRGFVTPNISDCTATGSSCLGTTC